MPILARQTGMGAAPPLWASIFGPGASIAWYTYQTGVNTLGIVTPQTKAALIAQAAENYVQAGMPVSQAQAQASADVTKVLMLDDADPSQLSGKEVFQGPVDMLFTGSPMPSGTLYDTYVADLPNPNPDAASWLSANWPLVALAAVGGFILYKFA